MPAATSRLELRRSALTEFAKLQALIDQVDPEFALAAQDDDTSIKDIIGHRAHWIALFLGWYSDGQAGRPVAFPAPGYKWNDLKRYNADLRAAQAEMSWQEAVRLLQGNHTLLMALIDRLDDSALYGGPMKGANNAWTTGRWAESAGPAHYRSAAKFIRQCLRRRDQR